MYNNTYSSIYLNMALTTAITLELKVDHVSWTVLLVYLPVSL